MFFVGPHDHRMLGGTDVVTDQQLLVQFFTGAQAGVVDGDIPVWALLGTHAEAGQVNQLFSKLGDLDRLAHIQHKHIATLPHRAGLDHQLRRLRNGHEITGDLRMRHRHRPARANLRVEARYDRA